MHGSLQSAHEALAVREDDHVTGAKAAEWTIVAYCDFECPHCARAHHALSRLLVRHEDRLRLVFRHFPLAHKHPLAQQAAEFAEAAAAQGRFWPVHDFLFTYQETLDLDELYDYAGKFGLEVERLEREVTGRLYRPRVARDVASGRTLGVIDTPTLCLNDRRYEDEETLARVVRRAA